MGYEIGSAVHIQPLKLQYVIAEAPNRDILLFSSMLLGMCTSLGWHRRRVEGPGSVSP